MAREGPEALRPGRVELNRLPDPTSAASAQMRRRADARDRTRTRVPASHPHLPRVAKATSCNHTALVRPRARACASAQVRQRARASLPRPHACGSTLCGGLNLMCCSETPYAQFFSCACAQVRQRAAVARLRFDVVRRQPLVDVVLQGPTAGGRVGRSEEGPAGTGKGGGDSNTG